MNVNFRNLAILASLVFFALTLAGLGVFEFLTSHARSGILAAVAIEVALALMFVGVARIEHARHETGTFSS